MPRTTRRLKDVKPGREFAIKSDVYRVKYHRPDGVTVVTWSRGSRTLDSNRRVRLT